MAIELSEQDRADLEALREDEVAPYDLATVGDWDEELTLSILANLPARRIAKN